MFCLNISVVHFYKSVFSEIQNNVGLVGYKCVKATLVLPLNI